MIVRFVHGANRLAILFLLDLLLANDQLTVLIRIDSIRLLALHPPQLFR